MLFFYDIQPTRSSSAEISFGDKKKTNTKTPVLALHFFNITRTRLIKVADHAGVQQNDKNRSDVGEWPAATTNIFHRQQWNEAKTVEVETKHTLFHCVQWNSHCDRLTSDGFLCWWRTHVLLVPVFLDDLDHEVTWPGEEEERKRMRASNAKNSFKPSKKKKEKKWPT